MTNQPSNDYGNFGVYAEDYHRLRPGYPSGIFDLIFTKYFKQTHGQTHYRFLDLGCGTGLSTIGLSNAIKKYLPKSVTFELFGLDKDALMINEAKKHLRDDSVHFKTGTISNDSVGTNFDMIVCASAFHWIHTDKRVVKKIRSLLNNKTTGPAYRCPFVVINRSIMIPNDFHTTIRAIAQKFFTSEIQDAKKEYYPSNILEENGFSGISSYHCIYEEEVPIDEFYSRAQSVSYWNAIPESKKSEANDELKKHIDTYSVNGNTIITSYNYVFHAGYRFTKIVDNEEQKISTWI